jgi:hypothetical protein
MKSQDSKFKNKFVCESYEFSKMNCLNNSLLLHGGFRVAVLESLLSVLPPPK